MYLQLYNIRQKTKSRAIKWILAEIGSYVIYVTLYICYVINYLLRRWRSGTRQWSHVNPRWWFTRVWIPIIFTRIRWTYSIWPEKIRKYSSMHRMWDIKFEGRSFKNLRESRSALIESWSESIRDDSPDELGVISIFDDDIRVSAEYCRAVCVGGFGWYITSLKIYIISGYLRGRDRYLDCVGGVVSIFE